MNKAQRAYNLGICGGSHAQMTGRRMIALNERMDKEKSDAILGCSDINSTVCCVFVVGAKDNGYVNQRYTEFCCKARNKLSQSVFHKRKYAK